MKPDKTEKTIIIILIILIIGAICSIYTTIIKPIITPKNQIFISTEETQQLPADIRGLSKKYHGFENLYNSDKLTFTYGYDTNSFDKDFNEKFHKTLSTRLQSEKLNYRYITIKNPKQKSDDIEIKNNKNINSKTCTPETDTEKEIQLLINTSNDCLVNACIIDMKNHKYITISRDIDFIIKTLKKYNPPAK